MYQTLPYCKPVAGADFTHWNHHHQNIALARGLTQSATLLWEYLIEEGFSGKEELIDLRLFNKWVAKHRHLGAYQTRTIKDALRRLIAEHLIKPIYQASAFFGKFYIQPLGKLIKPVLRCAKRKLRVATATLQPQNLDNALPAEQTTTTSLDLYSEAQALVEGAGLHYAPGSDKWMACYSLAEIARAILYFISNREKVSSNPLGWFRRCVQDGWAEAAGAWYSPPDSFEGKYLKRLREILADDSPD